MKLTGVSRLVIRQKKELAELFGFETRNKYEISDEQGNLIGFCAEQQKGLMGFIFRQWLGHWRTFELNFYNENRQIFLCSKHPFRFFFQEFEVFNEQVQSIGWVKQRWGFLRKKFDVQNANGEIIMEMRSGFFQFWTFPFFSLQGRERATIQKKWSGLLKEIFLDADNFVVTYSDYSLTLEERSLILAAAIFVDLQYFERKASDRN